MVSFTSLLHNVLFKSTNSLQDLRVLYISNVFRSYPILHLPNTQSFPFGTASIHPCQHGPAMLNIIHALQEVGSAPQVEQYMFIFLKFIQSVVPTIEYDYTFDVQVRGKDA